MTSDEAKIASCTQKIVASVINIYNIYIQSSAIVDNLPDGDRTRLDAIETRDNSLKTMKIVLGVDNNEDVSGLLQRLTTFKITK